MYIHIYIYMNIYIHMNFTFHPETGILTTVSDAGISFIARIPYPDDDLNTSIEESKWELFGSLFSHFRSLLTIISDTQ
jgi:hypothetical protein